MRILSLILVLCIPFTIYGDEEQSTIIVTENGLEMFRWDLDFVQEAKQSIEISAVFLGGKVAQDLLHTIEKRFEKVPQLQVFILTAPILLEPEDWQMIHHLKEKYPNNFHIEMVASIPILWPDISAIDNHIKMFVVDEKYFSMGGTNLDECMVTEGIWTPARSANKDPLVVNNLPAAMRDQDIVGRGSLAKELRVAFHKHYALWEHYNTTGIFEKNPHKFERSSHYCKVTQHPFIEKFETSERKRDLQPSQIKMTLGGPHQQHNEISQEYIRLIQ